MGEGAINNDGLLGGDMVFTRVGARANGSRSSDAGDPGPGNTTESRVLILVDGRRSVSDIVRLSPLPGDVTLRALRELHERGVLASRPEGEVPPRAEVVIDARPRAATPSEGVGSLQAYGPAPANVVVIDTRHRDRDAQPAPKVSVPLVQQLGTPVLPVVSMVTAPGMAAAPSGPPVEPHTPAPGLYRLGDYEVITRIGQGGMGSVYGCRKAGATGLDRLFTLKVVRQYSSQQELAEASLAREAKLGRLLKHPNIHSVVDSGTYKEQPFIILDYIEGVSLTDLLSGGRRPPAPVVVSIVLDVLRALEWAHGARDERGDLLGLVHCDISPPNILVGANGVSRLTDFGSCRIVAEEGPNRPDPLKLGKPSYMAPEQLCAEPLDSRTDLFALGVTMYGALTGQDIFAAESYSDVVLNVLRKRIPPPSEHGGPPGLDEFCRRALSRAREGRFPNATEMAKALVAASSSEGLIASPSEVGAYLRREHGEELDERRRRIERAIAGSPSPRVSTWELPPPPAPASTAGEKKMPARTLFIPGPDDGDAPDTEPVLKSAGRRAARDERDEPEDDGPPGALSTFLNDVWQVILKERLVIAFSVFVGAAVLIVTILSTRSGSVSQKPRATTTSDHAPAAQPPATVQR